MISAEDESQENEKGSYSKNYDLAWSKQKQMDALSVYMRDVPQLRSETDSEDLSLC